MYILLHRSGLKISATTRRFSSNVEDKWKGIGVRIEDDILVTKDGNENLTKKVPSDPNEIESLMS